MPIDSQSRAFRPVRIAILTVSDSRTPEDDKSGDTLVERVVAAGHELAARTIVRDDRAVIADQFLSWAHDENIEVVISTGGSGSAASRTRSGSAAPLHTKRAPSARLPNFASGMCMWPTAQRTRLVDRRCA